MTYRNIAINILSLLASVLLLAILFCIGSAFSPGDIPVHKHTEEIFGTTDIPKETATTNTTISKQELNKQKAEEKCEDQPIYSGCVQLNNPDIFNKMTPEEKRKAIAFDKQIRYEQQHPEKYATHGVDCDGTRFNDGNVSVECERY